MTPMLFWLLSPALIAASDVDSKSACPAEGLGTADCPARDSALLQVRSRNLVKAKFAQDPLSVGNICASASAQCGGLNADGSEWEGPTCCVNLHQCLFHNTSYSSCEPSQDPTQILSDQTNSASACVRGWGRCGGVSWRGEEWTGATCCVTGYACRWLSRWLSTCLPTYGSSGTSTTTTAPTQPSSPGAPMDAVPSGDGGSVSLPPTDSLTIPPTPTLTVPPTPTVTVPPMPTDSLTSPSTPGLTVPPTPTDSLTIPPTPEVTVPPLPTDSWTVPPTPAVTVPPTQTDSWTMPSTPTVTVPPTDPLIIPPTPTNTVPPISPDVLPVDPTVTAPPMDSYTMPPEASYTQPPLPSFTVPPAQMPEPEPEPMPEPTMPSLGAQGLTGDVSLQGISLHMAGARTGGPCGGAWDKCGGNGFRGPTCCVDGYTCERKDEWYSQCKPMPIPQDSGCAQPWKQCGGKKDGAAWAGPTCCTPGFTCTIGNEWWHSCKPQQDADQGDSATTQRPSPTTTHIQTPAPTTAATTTGAATTRQTAAPTTSAAPTTTASTTQAALPPTPGQKSKGVLTMWATKEALGGAQCEYGNEPVGINDEAVLPSYLRKGFHCAIGESGPGFGKGEQCGLCYEITSLNDNGVSGTPGKKSSAVVMVSDGGAGGHAHFDCILDGFRVITGAETGIFDVEFEQVPCYDVSGSPVIINWADQNEWYCKMMFENIGGWGQLDSVQACLDGSNCEEMTQFSGATWTGCPRGAGSQMTFTLRQRAPSGAKASITCECSGSWPWPTGQQCSCPENFSA